MTILVDARPIVDPCAGGVTRVARGLASALVDAMPDTTFVLATTGQRKPLYDSVLTVADNQRNRVLFDHLHCPNKLWSLACLARVTSFDRAFKRYKPDILLLTNIGFVGKPRLPYALVVHDLSFLIEPHWFSVKARLWHKAVRATELIKGARWLFAVSETTKRDLIKYLNINPEIITVIPIGIDMGTIEKNDDALTPPPINGRFLLCLGVHDKRKNVNCVLQAYNQLRQDPNYSDAKLVLTGARYDSMSDGIINLGRPTDTGLRSLYKHATAFLYPSWYEGFGLPLHEAAHYHTPCIASTAGALPETAPQGTVFAPPAKPHIWTEAMAQILDNPKTHATTTTLTDWRQAGTKILHTLSCDSMRRRE